jgi:two-component system, NtrC family, response regulator HydG
VKVNCASLNESLLESELFGHVKGAFTGAYRSNIGRFEAARHGDIFLDEIGDLPITTQIKLLRVLEENVVERVGDNKPIDIDVRIISATNRDLNDLVEKGLFREDLFYRINVIPFIIPPLRERVDDIPILAESFFRRIKLKTGKNIKGLSNDAMRLLTAYPWPGNVRELRSVFEYAFVACQGDVIEPEHFPATLLQCRTAQPLRPEYRRKKKKSRLIEALKRTRGNQTKAAEILGISRVTVWNQIKKYQIHMGDYQ